jgi:DNA-directed RNA polymerase subunit alpha
LNRLRPRLVNDPDFVAKNWRALIRPRDLQIEDHTSTHAKFRCEPLERGFGTTIGGALRRTLLSALPGAAITHVAFEGDEPANFAEIVIALKETVWTSEHATTISVRLDKQGPGAVTAGDIALVDGIACCNPDHRISTLGSGERIAIELAIGVGRGYAPAERHASDPSTGWLALDALFSPIRRVDFAVTHARVGHQTDYDRLALDVWTNGALDPVVAVERAARILRDQLGLFINFEELPEPVEVPRDEAAEKLDENLWRTVEELELSVRATNCLRNLNLTYIGELVQKTESELMKSRGFGRKSLTEIESVLAEMQLRLGMKLASWPKDRSVQPKSG